MTKLFFPDVNVWMALAVENHIHHKIARDWWEADHSESIGFCRFTQMGLLRLLTTALAMGGNPLTNKEAWEVYDAFQEDPRVRTFPELPPIDDLFRKLTSLDQSSPKLLADCYLAAYADSVGATLITFDKAFANLGIECVILT